MDMSICVLICDDHWVVRQGLKQTLADAPDFCVVAEAADGAECVRLVRGHMAEGTLDVVLLDVALPHRDGLDVLKQLKAEYPRLPVLMLSTYPDKQFALRALKLGACGYLNKNADPADLLAALGKAASGGIYMTPALAEALATSISRPQDEAGEDAAMERLSNREYQVFRLLAEGQAVGQIAERLHLSPNTVSTYRARILEKTGVRNDVELALYAVRQKLIAV